MTSSSHISCLCTARLNILKIDLARWRRTTSFCPCSTGQPRSWCVMRTAPPYSSWRATSSAVNSLVRWACGGFGAAWTRRWTSGLAQPRWPWSTAAPSALWTLWPSKMPATTVPPKPMERMWCAGFLKLPTSSRWCMASTSGHSRCFSALLFFRASCTPRCRGGRACRRCLTSPLSLPTCMGHPRRPRHARSFPGLCSTSFAWSCALLRRWGTSSAGRCGRLSFTTC
mmetsp:Transcript_26680/g.76873  ORF Transcript_26680/g.76873 Transcript_26680/m.76873 type:complete len:227 (+) Transcript_26680:1379-2059(+)